jgi:methionyl aminopeptidase
MNPTQELQLAAQRIACRIVRDTLDYLTPFIQEGMNAHTIDTLARAFITSKGGHVSYDSLTPTFPTSICVSVNEQVAHTPATSLTPFKAGDLVSLDLVVDVEAGQDVRMHGDSARTIQVAGGSTSARRSANFLNTHTQEALKAGLSAVKAGAKVSDITKAIESYVTATNKRVRMYTLSIVKGLGGHAIGSQMHMQPRIPNRLADLRSDSVLTAGMVLAIEPLLTLGTGDIRKEADGWTLATADGQPAAHAEHTVLVTPDGFEQLT